MYKKLMVTLFTLALMMTVFSNTGLALVNSINGTSFFNTSQPEWQQEYYQPLEPGELEIGEYRLVAGYAKMTNERSNGISFLNNNYNNKIEPWGILLNFDTAFSQELYFNMNYLYNPEYEDFDNDKEKMNSYELTLTHFTENDNQIFFGYSCYNRESRDYNTSTEEYSSPINQKNRYLYIGGEIRGNFPFVEKE